MKIPQFSTYIKKEFDLIDILKQILDQNFQKYFIYQVIENLDLQLWEKIVLFF